MYKIQQFLNYITLILALTTVGLCVYSIIESKRMHICFFFMILTIICNEISRIYNKKTMNLNKNDKKMLRKLKEEVENSKKK